MSKKCVFGLSQGKNVGRKRSLRHPGKPLDRVFLNPFLGGTPCLARQIPVVFIILWLPWLPLIQHSTPSVVVLSSSFRDSRCFREGNLVANRRFGKARFRNARLGVWKDPFLCNDLLSGKFKLCSGTDVTGRPGDHGMEWMEEAPCHAHPSRPLACACFNRCGGKGAFGLPKAVGDHFHCTVEASPGHIQCRFVSRQLEVVLH